MSVCVCVCVRFCRSHNRKIIMTEVETWKVGEKLSCYAKGTWEARASLSWRERVIGQGNRVMHMLEDALMKPVTSWLPTKSKNRFHLLFKSNKEIISKVVALTVLCLVLIKIIMSYCVFTLIKGKIVRALFCHSLACGPGEGYNSYSVWGPRKWSGSHVIEVVSTLRKSAK